MSFLRIALLVALSLLYGDDVRVRGGYVMTDYRSGNWTWYGIVYHRNSDRSVEYACGGTLLSEKHVVTARICATDEDGSLLDSGDVFILMGTRREDKLIEEYAQYRNVSKIHQPVDYNKTSKNELVILELNEVVKFNEKLHPTCLKTDEGLIRPDAVIGWRAVDGSTYLEAFQTKAKRCSNRRSNHYYNQTEICLKDRGSIGILEYFLYQFHVVGIIDCTSPLFVPCEKEPNFKTVELIQFSNYKGWITHVTNLTCLQDVQDTVYVKNEVQIKASPKTTFQCGQRAVFVPEDNAKLRAIDPYPGQWPWFGIIYHQTANRTVKYACGGTLISEKHVLTPRLCATNENGTLLNSADVLVRFGTHNQNFLNFGYAQHRKVRKIHSSAKLVILKLKVAVKLNDYIHPICLQYNYPCCFHGEVMLGWGNAEANGQLEHFERKMRKCTGEPEFWYYNQTDICSKDRGSISLLKNYNEWFLETFIDCTNTTFDPCQVLIQTGIFFEMNDYIPWIANVTNLNYLQTFRNGRNFDPLKQYPNLLPRLNCGQTLVQQDKSDRMLYKHPWIARISIDSYKTGLTGTLINHRYVLAAIDLSDKYSFNARNIIVRLGEYKFSRPRDFKNKTISIKDFRDYEVEYVIKHQNRYPDPDITLLRTKEFVLFEDHVHPICLPVTDELQRLVLPNYVLAGWTNNPNIPRSFQEATVYKRNCPDKRGGMTFCTDSFAPDYTWFMSGVPLGSVVESYGNRFVQFGIIPFTSHRLSDYLLYTNVSYFMNWIVANMEK